jgi:hypothetical protein
MNPPCGTMMITRVGCADDALASSVSVSVVVLAVELVVLLALVELGAGAGLYAGADAPNHEVKPDHMLLPAWGWPLPMYGGVAIGYPTNFETRLPSVRICSSRFAYDASEL